MNKIEEAKTMTDIKKIAQQDYLLSTKNVYISTSFNKYISELSIMQN